ncbi:MAG: winged helix-turn-helix domain-containing protein [Planctomycetaceae bacterium]
MTTVRIDAAQEIGSCAGDIWQYLNQHGPAAIAKLVKDLEQPRETILQGIGWLAREGKIEFIPGRGKARLVQLVD